MIYNQNNNLLGHYNSAKINVLRIQKPKTKVRQREEHANETGTTTKWRSWGRGGAGHPAPAAHPTPAWAKRRQHSAPWVSEAASRTERMAVGIPSLNRALA